MAENLLALIPEKPVLEAIKRLRDEYFRTTGDASAYAFPPCLLLGESEKNSFNRRTYHFNLVFPDKATTTEKGVFIALPLEEAQNELGLEIKIAGVYLGKTTCDLNIDVPSSKIQRLALLVKSADGYRLLQ